MKGKKSTRSALLTSITSLVLCFAMLLGTTFAWFTDTASTAVNRIEAGNLKVDLEMKDSNGNWVTAEGETLKWVKANGHTEETVLWEPGCTYQLPEIRVVNNGSLKLKYKIILSGITGDVGLNHVIDWTMTEVNDSGSTTLSMNGIDEAYLDPDTTSGAITIKGHMQESAGNEYQGLSIDGIAITVIATQMTGEYDSMGPNYDQNALYPEAVVVIPAVEDAQLTAVTDENGVPIDYVYSNPSGSVKVSVPADAVTDSGTAKVTVTPTAVPSGEGGVTVNEGQAAVAYQISAADGVTLTEGSGKLAEFELLIGKGLTNVTLYHNSIPMTRKDTLAEVTVADCFYYNADTGFATFKVDHLSPFTAVYDKPVASIGSTAYYSLQDALNVGGEVTLLKDVVTPTTSYYVRRNVTLNLNGKTLSGSGYDGVLCVDAAATLTINGDGKVIGNDHNKYGMAVWGCAEGALIVINGGEYSNTLTHVDDQMDMIYLSDGADAEINGGTFKCTTPKWTLNLYDDDYADGSSTFTVNGGKFYQYDPANSASESPVANFCGAGKGAIKNGDWYEVISGTFVSTEAELKDALAGTDSTIYLTKDIALTSTITIGRDCTLTGNGDATISAQPVYVAPTANVTFKNVNFATPDNTNKKASSFYASGLEGKVVFDGCTFTNPQWECIQITPMDGAEIIVTNCKFVADGTGVYAHGTKVERLLHIENTAASGKYTATITNNQFIGVDLCRNAVIDVDDIEAFANVTCGGNTFFNHDNAPVSTLEDGMIYVNINGRYNAANVATGTYAQFTQTPAAALHH